ncbi:MAG: DUF2442 domain-containing protein [Chloroflexi bacterium]|nr:DUF2442 domain-containing protein [Chloroflexota bacterium]
MSISRIEIEVPDAVRVEVSDDTLTVELSDARAIAVPLTWYPRLLDGRPDEWRNWRLIGRGQGIHWDDLDEDVSVEGLLAGRRSGESQTSLKRWLEARAGH